MPYEPEAEMACEIAEGERKVWIIEDAWDVVFGRDVAAQGGVHGGFGSGAGQSTELDRHVRREVEEIRFIRFDIDQRHEGKGFMGVMVGRSDFG